MSERKLTGLVFIAVALLFIYALLFTPDAAAQRTNTFYANQYDGATVGAKVAAAQNSCSPGIPCYIVLDADLAAYATGNLPAKCSGCYWLDYRNGGPSGSSAVVANVKDYGAKGDGIADDTAAFQSAAAAASGVSATTHIHGAGGKVYIPAGTYRVNPVGLLNTKVEGESRDAVTIKPVTTGSGYLLDGELFRDGVTIHPIADGMKGGTSFRNLTVDCEGKGYSGVRAYYAEMSHENVKVMGCVDGFTFNMPYMAAFHNLTAKSNSNDGFVFANSASECMTSLDLQNIWANGNGRYGVNVGCFNYLTITNSATQSSGSDGWHIDGTTPSAGVSRGLTLDSPGSEVDTGRPIYLKNIRHFEIRAPFIMAPGSAVNWIELDNSYVGVVSSWSPTSAPTGGKFHIVSLNDTGTAGITTLLQVYATTNGDATAFQYVNSSQTYNGSATNRFRQDVYAPGIVYNGVTFSTLGTPSNGVVRYCSDCTATATCAGSGTGAIAKRLNNAWVCN